MQLARRNATPMQAYRPDSIEDQFGRLVETMFGEFFAPFAAQPGARGGDALFSPRINISENDSAYAIQADLPGVAKEDVKVSIDQNRVTIEAESTRSNDVQAAGNVVYAERSAGKFMRSFALPGDIDDASAQARMENGVLVLTLPKKQGAEVRKLTVQ